MFDASLPMQSSTGETSAYGRVRLLLPRLFFVLVPLCMLCRCPFSVTLVLHRQHSLPLWATKACFLSHWSCIGNTASYCGLHRLATPLKELFATCLPHAALQVGPCRCVTAQLHMVACSPMNPKQCQRGTGASRSTLKQRDGRTDEPADPVTMQELLTGPHTQVREDPTYAGSQAAPSSGTGGGKQTALKTFFRSKVGL